MVLVWYEQRYIVRMSFRQHNNRSVEAAYYAVEKCSLSNMRTATQNSFRTRRYRPKVASIKVSIKMISPESISFYPLVRSNLHHVVLYSFYFVVRRKRKTRRDERQFKRERERERQEDLPWKDYRAAVN